MNSILFCCHRSSIFTVQKLIEEKKLLGLVVPVQYDEFLEELRVLAVISKIEIFTVTKKSFSGDLTQWLKLKSPDVMIVNTFPYKIPKAVLDIPKCGVWNFHGGQLPDFRGPTPVFWQIAKGVSELTMTLHKMDEGLDSGPILLERKLKITDWDTHDIALNRLAQKAPEMLDELFVT